MKKKNPEDAKVFPTVENVPYRGVTDQQKMCHVALEAQLEKTAEMIKSTLTEHAHYTDDCGEYLRGALELSAYLMTCRENGVEELVRGFQELADASDDPDHPEEDEYAATLYSDYPSDAISKEVEEVVKSLR